MNILWHNNVNDSNEMRKQGLRVARSKMEGRSSKAEDMYRRADVSSIMCSTEEISICYVQKEMELQG